MELSFQKLSQAFETEGYIADKALVTTVFLALQLGKPLLIEGAPGVGKTEIAKVLSRVLDTDLIRLQCYEGLDENKALYEWNYQRQLIHIQMIRGTGCGEVKEHDVFSRDYLLERPLLKAINSEKRSVLLIDEIDKTDEEFEAFLFEVLSDFQVSIPELGTLKARNIPVVILTSNNERDLSEGLRRRCVYLFIDSPSVEKELKIIHAKIPGINETLAQHIAQAVGHIRQNLNLQKHPSIAETLDWTRALVSLHASALEPDYVSQTLGLLLKHREDMLLFQQEIGSAKLCDAAKNPALSSCAGGHCSCAK